MKNSKSILKQFINEVVDASLHEIAKQPHDAEAMGFALSVVSQGSFVYLVLYDPGGFQTICEKMTEQPKQLSLDGKLDAVLYMETNPVVGYIRLEKSECGWVLRNSVANKGYGPMMHDIALSYVGKQGLIPDRESHTQGSRNVWNYYMTKRKSEFRTYPLSEDDPCAVYQYDEDSWFLDVRYVLKNPDMGKVQKLITKGNELTSSLEQSSSIPPKEILRRLGSFFFDQNYGS